MDTHIAHPGQEDYPDLKERMVVAGLGENTNPEITVEGGLVRFWVDEELVFAISEWDLGLFVDKWVLARLEQRWPLGGKQ